MNNFLTEDTKAIILLCGVLGKDRSVKSLSLIEYTLLVRWLIESGMRPGDLLHKKNIPDASLGSGLDEHRLRALLGRGVQLGFAVEEWQSEGIWIISRSDTDYPVRYKKHLKDKAPPLLFGVGDRSLLTGGGLGIVGSRNVDREGEIFARHVAELCAHNQIPVVSGGARGVDHISMMAALKAGGTAIGVLAENLLRKSVEREARHALADRRLLLLSANHPSACFTVEGAMGRNKLIYAMADYGLIVSAEYKKGGTWAGAAEELKREVSRPVFVRIGRNAPLGNNKLLELGAIPWQESVGRIGFREYLSDLAGKTTQTQKSLTLLEPQTLQAAPLVTKRKMANKPVHPEEQRFHDENKTKKYSASIYQAVLPVILDALDKPISAEKLAEILNVNKTQVNAWLKLAVNEKKVVKLLRPVRYERKRKELQEEVIMY